MEDSISRSDLRAELAELKLSLLTDLRIELDRKASRDSVERLAAQYGAHDVRISTLEKDKGEKDKVAEALVNDDTQRYTATQKWLAIGGFVALLLSLLMSFLALGPDIIHSWTG